jgi:hypothetical protein
MAHLIIGTRRSGQYLHEGVIRDGKAVVFACGHGHRNRDQSTGLNGRSARDCVTLLVRCARFPGVVDQVRRDILSGPQRYARTWSASGGTVRRLQEAAEAQVEELAASVAKVSEITGTEAICSYLDRVLFPAFEKGN